MGELLSTHSLINSYERNKPLGEILAEAGLISIYQVEVALTEQKKHKLRIGEIFASHGWIKQETVDFFADKWSILLQKRRRRPLTFYLYAAGLLDKEQLIILKHKQIETNTKIRLHDIALSLGYIRQETVDFFLKYLFEIDNSQNLSFSDSYQIIKKYSDGERDFQELGLNQAPLNKVNLKQIILNNSILKKANLNNSNLSYSSLVQVDLTLAELERANLSHTNFKKACLIEANLRKSNLQSAKFQSANLQSADLRGANLKQASFIAADLRGTKLDSVYMYDIFYNSNTRFDPHFNPIEAGWQKVE